MMNNELLAHSPRGDIPPQSYFEHITNVHHCALENAKLAIAFYSGDGEEFISWIEAAAIYHDLGKLDNYNQSVLRKIPSGNSRDRLPVAHEDAAVAELEKLGWNEALTLVYSHHRGLFSRKEDALQNQGRPFRDLKNETPDGYKVADHVDLKLVDYEKLHFKTGCKILHPTDPKLLHSSGFTRRIALSCLVDADHGDTARNYCNEVKIPQIEPRWEERLEALQRYVDSLPIGNSDPERKRNRLRKSLFHACFNASVEPRIRTCDAPVGTGKTTAVMSHLLKVAIQRQPKLRHIIVVLPYTNIITQSVKVYRNALVLQGENPEDVVAEHHHKADFSSLELRQLSTLWKAPIIVTTAVQFFETLGSHHPASLRKLHELPGSAVFIDEMHAAIPSHLWPQMWRWLGTWTRNWGGHLVFASGSLPRFWKLKEYGEIMRTEESPSIQDIQDLVTDDTLRHELKETEVKRITFMRRSENDSSLDCNGIIDFIISKPGPRLLIVNTVQTAAVIASKMRDLHLNVLHLSTALAPVHRDVVIERIKLRLRDKIDNWTLVSTSCVEAGIDFSFRTGFRERASTSSLIQIGGRVSRTNEFNASEVWDIHMRDDLFRENPTLIVSRQALDRFSLEELNQLHPAELATLAMKREWTSGAEEKAKQLIEDEKDMEYPNVSKNCKVIPTKTFTVIIDKALANAIEENQRVSKIELLRYSVQIWSNKIDALGLKSITSKGKFTETELYVWPYEYDPDFLGYMEGVLKLQKFISAGGAVI
jgi:CRISPR-associated endonuclease/helicase Cas3